MPFSSQAQWRGAFGGHLGKKMKRKAKQWAKESPSFKSLPKHKGVKRMFGKRKRKRE